MKAAIASLAVFFLLLSGCSGQAAGKAEPLQPPSEELQPSLPTEPPPALPQQPTSPQPEQPLKGVSLTPKSLLPQDFTDFFPKAKEAGAIVSWAGDWNELASENGAPKVVAELSKTYGYEPVIQVQFFTQSSGELLRPLDDAAKEAYLHSISVFAAKYKPKYVGVGIEVNMLHEKSPADFEEFVSFYGEVYDAVKAASPSTKVFTIFQLERMKGLHGGLFGGENDAAKAEWQLINRFPKSDLIAFTTYPGLIYKSPSEIPSDYYSEIRLHTSKPIAFTEIGWHAEEWPEGWESSEEEQAEFVERFFLLNKATAPELAIWPFLYDPNHSNRLFNTMGLISGGGKERPAFGKWKEAE